MGIVHQEDQRPALSDVDGQPAEAVQEIEGILGVGGTIAPRVEQHSSRAGRAGQQRLAFGGIGSRHCRLEEAAHDVERRLLLEL